MGHSIDNPYVGPRTFNEEERHLFFGREREARDLLSLVRAERLVMFYSPSGAGKSSLINTRLLPGLRQAGFQTLPVGRVRGSLPDSVTDIDNIFIFNLILSLDQNQHEAASFTQTTLSEYLRQRRAETKDDAKAQASPQALIIDQFEEIFTTNLEYWEKREDFLGQLRQAMNADPLLWVLLSLREEYVAPLEPYARLLPGKLRTRFYMRRLGQEAALEAIERPAEKGGRPFAPGVAQTLVDNLRQIRVQGQAAETLLGEFVEPVQLQVVCYQLWENLKGRPPGEITRQDLQELGDVDIALAQFYEQAIAEAIRQTGVTEIDLRDWFETQLITEAGTRGTVYRGMQQTGGLANQTVDFLANRYLLRAEVRIGGTWYELVHDRLVEPILQANRAWRLKQPLIQMAQAWADSEKNANRLLEGQQLKEALATNWQGLGPLVEEFLEASQAAQEAREEALRAEKEALRQRELEQVRALAEEQQKRAEEQAKATQRLRRLAITLAVVFLLAVGAAIVAGVQRQRAQEQEQIAREQATMALAAEKTAEARRVEAETAQADAVAAQQVAEVRQADAETAVAVAEGALADLEANIAAQLSVVEATQTGEPTSTMEPTPTPVAVAPTPTPVVAGTPAPTPTTSPTATPTISPTPTLNLAATATVEALQIQLAQVQATQTAIAAAKAAISFPPPGRIVFSSNRLSRADLYSMKGDGSDVIRLTFNVGFEADYSRSRNRIIFTSERDNNRAWLYTIDANGKEEVNIGGQEWDNWEPTFSPDGQRVAFVSSRTGAWDIYSMNYDGSDVRRLTDHPAKDSLPAWSPDGQRIAFVSEREGQPDIWLMDAEDGGNLVRLTDSEAHDVYPAWSPDGRQITFASNRNGNLEIYVMDVSGRNQRNLTNSPFDENYPAWSPDGNWLAFSRFTTNNEIFVMTTSGDHLTNLTNESAADWAPTWIP